MKTRESSKNIFIFEDMKTQLVAICTALLAVSACGGQTPRQKAEQQAQDNN